MTIKLIKVLELLIIHSEKLLLVVIHIEIFWTRNPFRSLQFLNLIYLSLALSNGCGLTCVLKLLNNSIEDGINNLQ